MNPLKMFEEINHPRRRFLGNAAMTFAIAQLGAFSPANAQTTGARSAEIPKIKPGTRISARFREADLAVHAIAPSTASHHQGHYRAGRA
jgi:hypothetical protein